MDAVLEGVIERLASLHGALDNALQGLPDEALDWSPGPGMNSPGVILAHMLGAERFWIGDVAGGEPSGRDRAAEFETRGRTVESFRSQAQATLTHSRSVLGRLTSAELSEERIALLFNRRVTAGWAVLHALEHTALHTGHIEITRQMWDHLQEEGQ